MLTWVSFVRIECWLSLDSYENHDLDCPFLRRIDFLLYVRTFIYDPRRNPSDVSFFEQTFLGRERTCTNAPPPSTPSGRAMKTNQWRCRLGHGNLETDQSKRQSFNGALLALIGINYACMHPPWSYDVDIVGEVGVIYVGETGTEIMKMTRGMLVVRLCVCVSIFTDHVGVNMWKAYQFGVYLFLFKSRSLSYFCHDRYGSLRGSETRPLFPSRHFYVNRDDLKLSIWKPVQLLFMEARLSPVVTHDGSLVYSERSLDHCSSTISLSLLKTKVGHHKLYNAINSVDSLKNKRSLNHYSSTISLSAYGDEVGHHKLHNAIDSVDGLKGKK